MTLNKPIPLFKLGRTVATPGALRAMESAQINSIVLLERHLRGDWGTVSPDDAKENEYSVQNGFRIVSAYLLPNTDVKVWVITEADRSITTILLPEEY